MKTYLFNPSEITLTPKFLNTPFSNFDNKQILSAKQMNMIKGGDGDDDNEDGKIDWD